MPKNDIGGFFVHLGVDVDKDGFEKGNKLVDGISDSFNKLIGTARSAMVVLASWKTAQDIAATGALENQIYMDSEAMGIEVEALNEWIASAKIAGVSSDGLVGSMGRLANVLNHITIDGSGIEAYAAQLGKLRLGIEDLEKLNDPAKAYELIIATAQERAAEAQQKIVEARNALELNPGDRKAKKDLIEAQKEKQRITVIVGDILGNAGQEYFIKLQNRRLSVSDALQEAGKTQFTDAQDTQKGMNFLTEWNTLGEELKSLKRLLGDEAAGIATPYLKELNEWIQENGGEIKSAIKTISDKTANIIATGVEKIGIWWDTNGNDVLKTLNTISLLVTGIATKVLDFGKSKKGEAIKDYLVESYASVLPSTLNILKTAWEGGDLFGALLQGFDDIIVNPNLDLIKSFAGKNDKGDASNRKMKDGIMRPDGTITQVAPDDWVIAARNLGDVAAAFIPRLQQPAQVSGGEYTINQTFNINGGNDMPQVIRQQAYNGTQAGLLELMDQSSRRLQLMSGTR